MTLNPRYKKGDVIVSGITSSAPNGFIRNVTGVQKTKGKYIIQTEPAVLTDVFEKAHIYKRIELAESQNESESYHIKNMNAVTNELQSSNILCKIEDEDNGTDYMFGKSFEEKEDPVSLSGEAGTSAWVEVSIDIVHGDIKCGIAIRTKEGAKASLECSASYSKELEKQLLTKKLPDYQFIVAGIPIVVTNELEIYTEAEINLEGNIGVSYELTAETTQGFNYNSKTGKVEEINQVTCESDGLQWNTISISGDTSMGSSVHLITKLYDASGMDMSLKIAGKAEGEAKVTTNKELDGYAGSLDLSIVPEIKGEIVVDTPVFDKNLLKQPLFEAALKPLWEKHWESSVNWQDDLQWKENDKNEESQETTKVSYSNEYFEVIVPESWEGEWTVTEEDNTMNGIKSTLYRFSHDPADGEEGGAADVYVLDMSDTSIPLSHYSRMLPSAGCEEVGLTSFGYNDVFKMEVANGFFYENGATITLK